jgi:hypothetical protein
MCRDRSLRDEQKLFPHWLKLRPLICYFNVILGSYTVSFNCNSHAKLNDWAKAEPQTLPRANDAMKTII